MNYKTAKECSEAVGLTKRTISKWCQDGKLDWFTEGNRHMINLDSLMDYMMRNNIRPRRKIGDVPPGDYALLAGYDYQYAIHKKTGTVVNLDYGNILTPQSITKKDCSLQQVTLRKNGKREGKLVHRLYLEAGLLPNRRGCNQVHHIDGNETNNKRSNLLPVFGGAEHRALDNARKNKSKKDYRLMINNIKKLNREKLYKIPHPDYEPDEHHIYYMWVTMPGKKAYDAGAEIPMDSIRRVEAVVRK